jgi:hypothetical protein
VKAAIRDALARALNQSPTEPHSDAFILLQPDARCDLSALVADVAATFPFAPPVTSSRPPESWGPSFRVGPVTVGSYILPVPLPADQLEASSRWSWLWPTAAADLRGHAQMMTLSASSGDAAERMVALTMLTAAVFGTCPQAAGVLWDPAGHLVRGDVFRAFAAKVMPAQLPLLLWLGLPAWPNPDGTCDGYTIGLREFGCPEIEMCDAPLSVPALRQRISDLAPRLIAKEIDVPDGTTMTVSATQTVTVSYGESRFGQPGRVMRFRYCRTGPPKS